MYSLCEKCQDSHLTTEGSLCLKCQVKELKAQVKKLQKELKEDFLNLMADINASTKRTRWTMQEAKRTHYFLEKYNLDCPEVFAVLELEI